MNASLALVLRALWRVSWLVLPLAAAAAQATPAAPLVVAGLPEDAPLTVRAELDAATLRVHVVLQRGWHLYGRDVGGGKPVTVRIDGGAFAAAGELMTPMDAQGLITGTAELRLPLRRAADGGGASDRPNGANGAHGASSAGSDLRATMSFMVCDALQCLPPIELQITSPPPGRDRPFAVLLVAADASERTERIAAFLRGRGFAPTVTTYAQVTAAQCDAHEVVLADSPTFGQLRGKKVDARRFPATASPVVAVGFLGTQLLEAHKVAMACGYI